MEAPLIRMVDDVEEWACKNQLLTARVGLMDEGSAARVVWRQDCEVGWQKFLETARDVGAKIVWIVTLPAIVPTENELSELLTWLPNEARAEYAELYTFPSDRNNLTASVWIYWSCGGVLNLFVEEPAWANDYHDHAERVNELRSRVNNQKEIEARRQEREVRLNDVSQKARELLQHPKYALCKNRRDREFLASQLFEKKDSLSEIIREAETLNRME